MDDSKAMEKEGYKRVVISSTPGKSPYTEDGSFSKQFLEKMQEDVTRLGNKFAEHVAKYTGLPVEAILKMDAQTFHAEEALEIGLVNAIMTPREFINHLSKRRTNARRSQKKLLGDKPDEQLAEVAEEVVTEAVTQNVEQSLATDLQSALSQVEELNAALQAKDSLLAELNSKLEALSEFAAKAEAHAEALRVEAEQKALAEKREKLANVIGADNPKLDAVFARWLLLKPALSMWLSLLWQRHLRLKRAVRCLKRLVSVAKLK